MFYLLIPILSLFFADYALRLSLVDKVMAKCSFHKHNSFQILIILLGYTKLEGCLNELKTHKFNSKKLITLCGVRELLIKLNWRAV